MKRIIIVIIITGLIVCSAFGNNNKIRLKRSQVLREPSDTDMIISKLNIRDITQLDTPEPQIGTDDGPSAFAITSGYMYLYNNVNEYIGKFEIGKKTRFARLKKKKPMTLGPGFEMAYFDNLIEDYNIILDQGYKDKIPIVDKDLTKYKYIEVEELKNVDQKLFYVYSPFFPKDVIDNLQIDADIFGFNTDNTYGFALKNYRTGEQHVLSGDKKITKILEKLKKMFPLYTRDICDGFIKKYGDFYFAVVYDPENYTEPETADSITEQDPYKPFFSDKFYLLVINKNGKIITYKKFNKIPSFRKASSQFQVYDGYLYVPEMYYKYTSKEDRRHNVRFFMKLSKYDLPFMRESLGHNKGQKNSKGKN